MKSIEYLKRKYTLLPVIFSRIQKTKNLEKLFVKKSASWYLLRIKKEMLQIRKHVALMDVYISELEHLERNNKT